MGADEESKPERATRRYQRTLFNDVAELYEATRPGYPRELVEFIAETAGLPVGAPVLEVGCGTGQLTEHLAALGFRVTAIDLGPSMIEAARRKVSGGAVSFGIGAFEELDLAAGSFHLIISGAAFHWIDPEVRFRKSARILRPGGWLAVVGNSENYDEPLRGLLEGMWAARGDVNGAWATRRVDAAVMAGSGLFGPPVHRTWSRRMSRPAADVIGVENTRSISLSWPDDVREGFNAELRQHLGSADEVYFTLESPVTMARVAVH